MQLYPTTLALPTTQIQDLSCLYSILGASVNLSKSQELLPVVHLHRPHLLALELEGEFHQRRLHGDEEVEIDLEAKKGVE